MRKLLNLFLVLMFVTLVSSLKAQVNYDKAPVFAEGKMSLTSFIDIYSKYPEKAVLAKQEGTVILSVKISEKGENLGVTVKQSVSADLDKEALRVAALFPDWTPAQKAGKSVASTKDVPFKFQMTKDTVLPQNASEKRPLYVVNGKQVKGNLNVDPQSITSIRVKKGAAAVALYGDDGRDGVIIITTR